MLKVFEAVKKHKQEEPNKHISSCFGRSLKKAEEANTNKTMRLLITMIVVALSIYCYAAIKTTIVQ